MKITGSVKQIFGSRTACPRSINTSQRRKGINTQSLNQKINASCKKINTLGNEYVRAKDDTIRRQKINLMFRELSAQMVCLSEQNIALMRKLEKQKQKLRKV